MENKKSFYTREEVEQIIIDFADTHFVFTKEDLYDICCRFALSNRFIQTVLANHDDELKKCHGCVYIADRYTVLPGIVPHVNNHPQEENPYSPCQNCKRFMTCTDNYVKANNE